MEGVKERMNTELMAILKKERKKHKFNADSCSCFEGHLHDSRDEARYCEQLHIELRNGDFTEIKIEPDFDLVIDGKRICSHRPDFLITHHDGSKEVIEYKGFFTSVWRLKKKLFEALYPHIPYKVVYKKDLWRIF